MPQYENLKECSELSMPALVLKEGMDQWLLAVTSGSAAKGSAKGVKVVGPGPGLTVIFPRPPPSLSYHV